MTVAANTDYPKYSPGFQQRIAFRPEAAVGDSETLSTAYQELKVLSGQISEELERNEDNSKRGTLSLLEQFNGKRSSTFNLEQRLRWQTALGPKPSEHGLLVAAGLAHQVLIAVTGLVGVPVIGDVITGASGSGTIAQILGSGEYRVTPVTGTFTVGEALAFVGSGATANMAVYTNRYTPAVPGSSSPAPYSSIGLVSDTAAAGESLSGAYLTALEWGWDGADSCKLMAEGMGRVKSYVGVSSVVGAHLAGATVITVSNAKRFERGGLVQFAGDPGPSNLGFRLADVDVVGGTITLATGLVSNISNGAAVGPVFPSATVQGGSILKGTMGQITFDPTGTPLAVCTPSGNVRYETAFGSNADCYGTETYSEAFAINRRVTGEIVVKYTKEQMAYVNDSRRESIYTALQIIHATSDGLGLIRTYMPRVQFDPVATLDIPEEDAVQITYAYKALGTAGNDEIQINYENA